MFTEKRNSISDAGEATDDLSLISQLQSADSLDAAYRARNALIERHMGLVAATVRRVVPVALSSHEDDAYQEASCALIEIAASFDPRRGIPFRAYASVAMVNRIRSYLQRHGNLVEGEGLGRRLGKIRKFLASVARDPDDIGDAELSTATGLPLIAVRRLRPWLNRTVWLDAAVGPDGHDRSAGTDEFVPSGETPIPDTVCHGETVEQLHRLMATLQWKDQYLLNRVFGLDGSEPVTVSEAVVALGFSQQRGSMRIRRALERLREAWCD